MYYVDVVKTNSVFFRELNNYLHDTNKSIKSNKSQVKHPIFA